MTRPLTALTDAELARELERYADRVGEYSYNAVVAEMDRREAKRAAAANVRFARIALLIATVSVIVSAVGIAAQLLR